MNLYDLVPYELMNQMKVEGYIRTQQHPTLPLIIHNYTEKAQFEKMWNQATRACRGLITTEGWPHLIVARPFSKFFNYGEHDIHQLLYPEELVSVTDKMDGSLGIMYQLGVQGPYIATRGSFTSDQAIHATELLRRKYPDFHPHPSWTYLFEIIYPENRIVVDYSDTDDLFLLGMVENESGAVLGPEVDTTWPGPRTQSLPYQTLKEALTAPLRAGKEGMVIRFLADNTMVKVKQPEYVELHRIVTGLNEKEIWRRTMRLDLEGERDVDKMAALLADIPDEMHGWVESVAFSMIDKVRDRERYTQFIYANVIDHLDYGNHTSGRGRKKAFAMYLQDNLGLNRGHQKGEDSWIKKTLFLLYDGFDPKPFLWKLVEPKGDVKR
jgi:putative RNA ligase